MSSATSAQSPSTTGSGPSGGAVIAILDVNAEHSHHARWGGGCVCRWCPGWIDYRCVVCGAGGPLEGLYHAPMADGGPLFCWPHRPVQEQQRLW